MSRFLFILVTLGCYIYSIDTRNVHQNAHLSKNDTYSDLAKKMGAKLYEIKDVPQARGFSKRTQRKTGEGDLENLPPLSDVGFNNEETVNGVDGKPGHDFPVYRSIPRTKFNCRRRRNGYYADEETNCQVFHICDNGRKISFLCPNGTIFRQSDLICDWWFKVDCETESSSNDDSPAELTSAARNSQQRLPSGFNSADESNDEIVSFAASTYGGSRNRNSYNLLNGRGGNSGSGRNEKDKNEDFKETQTYGPGSKNYREENTFIVTPSSFQLTTEESSESGRGQGNGRGVNVETLRMNHNLTYEGLSQRQGKGFKAKSNERHQKTDSNNKKNETSNNHSYEQLKVIYDLNHTQTEKHDNEDINVQDRQDKEALVNGFGQKKQRTFQKYDNYEYHHVFEQTTRPYYESYQKQQDEQQQRLEQLKDQLKKQDERKKLEEQQKEQEKKQREAKEQNQNQYQQKEKYSAVKKQPLITIPPNHKPQYTEVTPPSPKTFKEYLSGFESSRYSSYKFLNNDQELVQTTTNPAFSTFSAPIVVPDLGGSDQQTASNSQVTQDYKTIISFNINQTDPGYYKRNQKDDKKSKYSSKTSKSDNIADIDIKGHYVTEKTEPTKKSASYKSIKLDLATDLSPPEIHEVYSRVTKVKDARKSTYSYEDYTTERTIYPKTVTKYSPTVPTVTPRTTSGLLSSLILPPTTPSTISENGIRMLRTLDDLQDGRIDSEEIFGQGPIESRPGLKVPPSSSPDTLHSLAVYFASALNDMINDTRKFNEFKRMSEPKQQQLSPQPLPLSGEEEEKLKPGDNIFTKTTVQNYDRLFEPKKSKSLPLDDDETIKGKIDKEFANDLDSSQSEGLVSNSTNIRKLARIFTHALSEYLRDPETFRRVLNEIRPTEPPQITEVSTDHPSITKEEGEVLDFSDIVKTTPYVITTVETSTTSNYFPDNYFEKLRSTPSPYGQGVKPRDSKPFSESDYKKFSNFTDVVNNDLFFNPVPVNFTSDGIRQANLSVVSADLVNYFIPEELNNLATITVNENLPPSSESFDNYENMISSQSQSFLNDNRVNKNVRFREPTSTETPTTTESITTVATTSRYTYADVTTEPFVQTTETTSEVSTTTEDATTTTLESTTKPKRGRSRYNARIYDTTTLKETTSYPRTTYYNFYSTRPESTTASYKNTIPNDHWTKSPGVHKLIQTTITLDPHVINKELANNTKTKVEDKERRGPNAINGHKKEKGKSLDVAASNNLIPDYLEGVPKDVQVKSAHMIFGNLNESSQIKLMETMKHADSNKSVKKLILLLINTCENASHNETLERARNAIVNALLSQSADDNPNPEVHIYDKYPKSTRKMDMGFTTSTTQMPNLARRTKSLTDELATPGSSDARAIALLKSLYGLAHKWGSKR